MNNGVMFKSIVLLNADSLTNDAQSALRRCIELFSFNTRFFIVVENKHKLLNPILSRFCEIYVPECIRKEKIVNLHQYHLEQKFGEDDSKERFSEFITSKMQHCKTQFLKNQLSHEYLTTLSLEIYENGYSCLDLMNFIEETDYWNQIDHKSNILLCFHKIKLEFRCEKLLILYMLDFMFLRLDTNLKNVSFI